MFHRGSPDFGSRERFRQGSGSAGINEATKMVTSYFDPATKLIYAIGAVVGLINPLCN